MNTQFVQLSGNPDLVLQRKGNVLGLGAVAKGGIIDFNRLSLVQSFLASVKPLE
jgi:hypothetical protein